MGKTIDKRLGELGGERFYGLACADEATGATYYFSAGGETTWAFPADAAVPPGWALYSHPCAGTSDRSGHYIPWGHVVTAQRCSDYQATGRSTHDSDDDFDAAPQWYCIRTPSGWWFAPDRPLDPVPSLENRFFVKNVYLDFLLSNSLIIVLMMVLIIYPLSKGDLNVTWNHYRNHYDIWTAQMSLHFY